MFYEKLFEALDKEKVKYVLVGGMAVALHGVPRITMDVDFIVHLENRNLKKFLTIVSRLGYKPKVPVDPLDFADPKKRSLWINEKNMIVFNFYHPKAVQDQVDVFVKEPIDFQSLWKEKIIGHLGPIKVYLAAIPHMIQMKREAGRAQDISDIEQLKRIQERQTLGKKTKKKRV